MLVALLAAAAAASLPSSTLDLELTCSGQYSDTETSTGNASVLGPDGKLHTGVVTTNVSVMRPGTARISLHGASGKIVYPDGRERTMQDIRADDGRITGSYKRLGIFTWRMEINRLTGDVLVKSGGTVGLIGSCSLAPVATQPRF